jgi:hypothetical protein
MKSADNLFDKHRIKQNLLPDNTPKAKRKLRPFNSAKPDT